MPIPYSPSSPSSPTTTKLDRERRSTRPFLNKCQSSLSGSSRTRPLFRRASSSLSPNHPRIRLAASGSEGAGLMGSVDSNPGPEHDCVKELGSAAAAATATATANSLSSSLSLCLVRNRVVRCNWFFFYLLVFTCMASMGYTILLRKRIATVQGEMIELRRLFKGNDSIDKNSFEALELTYDNSSHYFGDADTKTIAFYIVIFTILMPFLLYKYLDYLPQLKSLSKRTEDYKEEVPPKKKLAYMVDVCFSVYPYAKLLALLFATIFLIGFGGLALYAVSDNSFTEALWLSWTFVADSGNHADRVGIAPRIVSLSISAGGRVKLK